MLQNFYTLPDLVDLALKVPEIGAVNFNILHIVLQTLIAELRLHNVRPWCHIENPLLAKTALTKAKLQGKTSAEEFGSEEAIRTERPRPQAPPPAARQKVEETPSKSEEKKEPGLTFTREEAVSSRDLLPGEPSEEKEHEEAQNGPPEEKPEAEEEIQKNRKESAGWDDITQRIRSHRKSLQEENEIKLPTAKDNHKIRDAWRYEELRSKVIANSECLTRLSDLIDYINDQIKKSLARRTPGGISAGELEGLEERVEELEDAWDVFEEDHLKLSDVQKIQKEMVEQFEEIKALGSEIKEMKVEIAAKADLKEMEEALALKGDLELVNTKVDQTEFETAIEELGEAIGLLGIKFQKKNEEWEERAADVWRAIDGKMSRDVFDEAVLNINSRLKALMYGLKRIKKVVEDLIYPDASGVTRCIVCRRPAGISGHECFDPKQIYKRSGDSSDGSDDKESFLKNVNDALAKRPKLNEPPFCVSRDTINSIPFSSSTYRSSPKETFPETKVDLRLAPIKEKTDRSRETGSLEEKSQVPKLPQINRHEKAHTSSKQKQEIQFSVPKVRAKEQHRELIFTKKVLSRLQKEGKLTLLKSQPPRVPQPSPSQTTPSRESKISDSTDIMSDSAGNLQSFAPMRLMQDPLRREMILSPPETNRQYKPHMILAPLSTGASSYKDSSATS